LKNKPDLDDPNDLRKTADSYRATDAVERHDRRHPDRKIVESFDVSVFE
jgi:hypothetical protein